MGTHTHTNVLVTEGAAACHPCPLCSFRGKAACGSPSVLHPPPWGGWPSSCHTGFWGRELGCGFEPWARACACRTARGVTCSLVGILKCCTCLVCENPPAKCTRRGSSALCCSKASHSQWRWAPSSANTAQLCWEVIAFPQGKEINAQSP